MDGNRKCKLRRFSKEKRERNNEGKDLKTVTKDINQDKTTKPNIDSFKGSKTGEVNISQPIIDKKEEIVVNPMLKLIKKIKK